jgi:C4-dicarboxylate transporter/malic acid transport protein
MAYTSEAPPIPPLPLDARNFVNYDHSNERQAPSSPNYFRQEINSRLQQDDRSSTLYRKEMGLFPPPRSPVDSIDMEKGMAVKITELQHNPHAELISGVNPPLPFGQRLRHFTWAWYTLTMSTGGVATLISIQPHSFKGLITIGAIFYILNLIFFVVLCTMMLLRFTKYPGTLKESLKHEREGLFFGPFWLSVATIITGTQKYVVQSYEQGEGMRGWLTTSMAIAFYGYTICTFLVAVLQYSYLFNSLTYKLDKFMPSWLLPIFPVMLSGTIASVIAADQPLPSRYAILFVGLGCQGLGFTVAVIFYAHYIGRLMSTGLPCREHRGAMFIGVGPPSFTALALIGMSNAIPVELNLVDPTMAFYSGSTIRVIAIIAACSLWVLAFWFFCLALVAVLLSRPKLFHLGWWAMVFPNTGFTIATISIGNAIKSEGMLYLGNGMTIGILLMWAFVLFMNIRAVLVRDIMYPHMDEDVAD